MATGVNRSQPHNEEWGCSSPDDKRSVFVARTVSMDGSIHSVVRALNEESSLSTKEKNGQHKVEDLKPTLEGTGSPNRQSDLQTTDAVMIPDSSAKEETKLPVSFRITTTPSINKKPKSFFSKSTFFAKKDIEIQKNKVIAEEKSKSALVSKFKSFLNRDRKIPQTKTGEAESKPKRFCSNSKSFTNKDDGKTQTNDEAEFNLLLFKEKDISPDNNVVAMTYVAKQTSKTRPLLTRYQSSRKFVTQMSLSQTTFRRQSKESAVVESESEEIKPTKQKLSMFGTRRRRKKTKEPMGSAKSKGRGPGHPGGATRSQSQPSKIPTTSASDATVLTLEKEPGKTPFFEEKKDSDDRQFQKPISNRTYGRQNSGANETIEALKAVEQFLAELSPCESNPLSKSNLVLVMQGWNKALAFKSAFSEALLIYWRILCCEADAFDGKAVDDSMDLVEENRDPIYQCFKERMVDAEELLMGVLDAAIRSLCPAHQQVQREAYRPMSDDAAVQQKRGKLCLECKSIQDHLGLFARLGISPGYWVCFVHAVLWALKTHTPYSEPDDLQDLELGPQNSAFGRVVALKIAIPAIQTYHELVTLWKTPVVCQLQEIWGRVSESEQLNFGEAFYRRLLTDHDELLDYFSRTDMDSLVAHFGMTVDLIVMNVHSLGPATNIFRKNLDRLGEIHRMMNIPTYAYALMEGTILDVFQPIFDKEEKDTRDAASPASAKLLRYALSKLFNEVGSIVYYPMLRQEKLLAAAHEFYEQVKEELGWSDAVLEQRMHEIETEIASKGSYTQTSEDLETGARLAWRNSAKCIGRIAWNTLKVRDRRHIRSSQSIFEELRKHLLEATSGTNIQSLMTVFKPQSPSEPFGTRFWSSQLVRYAAYKDSQTGSIMGDKANLELTEYLIDNYLWTPPDKLTPFDVLPWVLKVPGKKTPIVKYVPNDCIFEVILEHPSIPELSTLDLRWTTVPAISNFKMNLGGVVYQNIPFNGWFVTTEIVRNLMERYDVGPDVARVIGLDIKTDPMWRQTASCELERMVNYSFQKNGFTIVDPMTVGRSFCTHVQREREQFGRECPAQWSWIGGLVGPTNPTWHLEMRDFLVNPQYEYCAEGLLLHTAANEFVDDDATQASGSTQNSSLLLSTRRSPSSLSLSSLGRSGSSSSLSSLGDSTKSLASLSRQEIPNVLIVYGSETGNAEAVARRLKTDLRLVSPILRPLNEVKGLDIIKKRKITHVLAVCSTFGEGAPPANAEEFFHADIQPVKREASFSVLALGSSIYPSFCQAGVDLDKILEQAGHQRAAQIMKADDATGSESTIDDWLKLVKNIVLPASLQQYLIELDLISDSGPPTHNLIWLPPDETSQCPTIQNTFERTAVFCTLNTELVAPGAAKSVRKISFQAPAPYESGDHLSVLPLNSEAIVRRFLHCFEAELMGAGFNRGAKSLREQLACIAKQPFDLEALDGDTVEPADVFFETPTTLEYILKAKVDLSLKAKDVPDLLRLLKRTLEEKLGMISEAQGASLSSTPDFQELFSLHKKILQCHPRKRTNVMDDFIASYPTIVGFFERFKAILLQKYFDDKPVLRLAEVLVILSRLQPRHYSISSSNNMNPKEISITVGVLNVETSKGVMIEGVCSNYLATLRGGKDKACIAVHKSSFRLPKDHQAPIIMVGAGTGLSPMMGFLEDRALDKKNGKSVGVIHLFFGCRSEKDFIYKDQIRKWDKEGLMRCHLALSRLTGRKQYVQDKICEFGKDIADLLLRDDTHYYVCGDARMANVCYEVCVGLLRDYGNISRVSSKQHLKKMRLAGRWQSDVWGIVSNYEDARKDVRKTRKTLSNEWIAQFEELEDADFTEVDDDEELSFSF